MLENREQAKTRCIKELQSQIAEKYTKIMAEIASFCEEVMGISPCKYAIVGMGSRARQELLHILISNILLC